MHELKVTIGLVLICGAMLLSCSNDKESNGTTGDTASDSGTSTATTDTSSDSGSESSGDTATSTTVDSDTVTDSDSNICEIVSVDAKPNPPRVMILQDLSSSLNSNGRWDALKAAMIQVVDTFDDVFSIGLVPFATTILDGVTNDADCTVTRDHVIAPGQGNAEAIKNKVYLIESADLVGGTPTYEALVAAREVLVDNDPLDGSQRVAILVTDGMPNCLDGNGGGGSTPEDKERVTNEIKKLHDDDNILVYIVAYDMGTNALMDQWATNGGTSVYYPASNSDGLIAQMDTIKTGLIPCDYTLEKEIVDPALVRVQIDGQSRPYNEANGWILGADKKSITLIEGSCDKVRDGQPHEIAISVECEPVIVVLE